MNACTCWQRSFIVRTIKMSFLFHLIAFTIHQPDRHKSISKAKARDDDHRGPPECMHACMHESMTKKTRDCLFLQRDFDASYKRLATWNAFHFRTTAISNWKQGCRCDEAITLTTTTTTTIQHCHFMQLDICFDHSSSKYHQNVIKMSSKCHQNIIKISSSFSMANWDHSSSFIM